MNRMKEKNKATAIEFTFYDDPPKPSWLADPLLKLTLEQLFGKPRSEEAPTKGPWFEIIP